LKNLPSKDLLAKKVIYGASKLPVELTSRATSESLDRPKLEISDPMGFAKVTAKKAVREAKKRIVDKDVFWPFLLFL
jgi:hypothetical protein